MSSKILLIGAGPIGIEVAAALKISKIDYFHVEAGSLASTIAWWAPGTTIFSSPERIAIADMPFAVYPQIKATREEYLNYLRLVVQKYSLRINFYKRVVSIKKLDNEFIVKIANSNYGVGGEREYLNTFEYEITTEENFSKIILAIGDMHQPKELKINGEKNANVSHFLTEPNNYFGLKVCIVGAKNSAAEAVVRLGRIGANITWSCRDLDLENTKIKPWLLPDIKGLLKEGRVNLLNYSEVVGIENNIVELRSLKDKSISKIVADKVLLLTGYRQDSDLYEQLGITLSGESKTPRFDPDTMQTDVNGVFVAGTGIAGTQIGGAKIFIENCHDHSIKIARALGSREKLFSVKSERVEQEREQ